MNAPMIPASPANNQRFIETAEAQRDLRVQLQGVGQEDEQEIQFIEWSPGRRMVTIWNMQSGEEVTLPRYQAVSALNTPNPRGGWMWTSHQEQAPPQRVNNVKCFLHPESPERALLDEIGITQVCMTGHLANQSAKRQHAKRHASSWEQYQEEVSRREKAAAQDAQAQQTAAIMALAGQRAEKPATGPREIDPATAIACDADGCEYVAKNAFGLSAHKRGKHGG